MNPKRQRQIDQGLAEIRELTPGAWWAMYQGAMDKGFTPTQAMELVKTHMFASHGCPVILSSREEPVDDPEDEEPKK